MESEVTFGDTLFLVNSGLLLLLAGAAFYTYTRQRNSTRIAVAVLFFIQSLSYILNLKPVWSVFPDLVMYGILAGYTVPWLKIRLIRHLQTVPKRVEYPALILMGLSFACALLWQPSGYVEITGVPLYMQVATLVYFGVVETLAIIELVKGARRSRGLTQWRLLLVTAGSISFLLMYAAEYGLKSLGYPGAGVVAFRLFSTLSTLAYFLGFSPPRWACHLIQLRELYQFMDEGTERALSLQVSSLESMGRLCAAAKRAVGATATSLLLWDDLTGRLNFWAPGVEEEPFRGSIPIGDGPIGQAWRERRSVFASDVAAFGPEERRLSKAVSANTLIVVPIKSGHRLLGVLLVFLRHGSLFPEDDLHLLNLMAVQEARVEELERMIRSQSDFLAGISHDLRSPLTVILAHTDLLRRGQAREPQQSLTVIHEKGMELQHLIEALFAKVRMESSRGEERRPVNLTELVRKSVIASLPLIDEAGMQLDDEIPDEPVWVEAVPGNLERVINNFVTNACKYGAAGRWLGLYLSCENGWVRLRVIDRGEGIAPELQERVFDRLFRGQESQGAGLGLAIAKEIIQRHQGRIGVESPAGGGCCLWFALPVIEHA